jgi:hypothetical protein
LKKCFAKAESNFTIDFEYDQLRLKGLTTFANEIGVTDLTGKVIVTAAIEYGFETQEEMCQFLREERVTMVNLARPARTTKLPVYVSTTEDQSRDCTINS